MAYIPGFKHDIFISYVHDDNDPEIASEDGWVDQFYQYLDRLLNKHDASIELWWDSKRLNQAEKFDDSIKEAIEKSAIMICLYSRRYLKSNYCKMEMNLFFEQVKSQEALLNSGHYSRIIPVLTSNINYREWPEELSGTSGFHFHDAENEDEYGDPLKVTAKKFEIEMKKLRDDLVSIMEAVSKNSQHTKITESESIQDEDAFTIFFGEIDDSLYDRREGIINSLKNNGIKVITANASDEEKLKHDEQTKAQIDKADLAVHILGEFPGRKIKDDPTSRYIQRQVEIGFDSEIPQLIWLSTDINIEDIKNREHCKFLQGIEEHELNNKPYDFVQGIEGNLLMLVNEHIKLIQLKEKQKEIQEIHAEKRGGFKVLLDTHVDDFKQAFNLKKILSNHDVELIFNPEDGDPRENVKSLYNNISEAQKFIFLYGSKENEDWVDIRVKKTLQKLTEFDRFDQDIFIYMAPPEKQPDSFKLARHPLIKVVDYSQYSSLDEEKINTFLNDLKEISND